MPSLAGSSVEDRVFQRLGRSDQNSAIAGREDVGLSRHQRDQVSFGNEGVFVAGNTCDCFGGHPVLGQPKDGSP